MPGESCQQCAYLVGHSKGCPQRDVDPKTEGWNEAIEAVAKDMDTRCEVACELGNTVRAAAFIDAAQAARSLKR